MHSQVLRNSHAVNVQAGPSRQKDLDAKTAFKPRRGHRKAKSVELHSDAASALGGADERESGAPALSVISALQEFLQDSKSFKAPTQHSILQWHFEEQFVSSYSNQFRATAAFLLDGVPHHVAGDWQTSKNGAKRDAAERALGLFVREWGLHLLQDDQSGRLSLTDSGGVLQKLKTPDFVDHVEVLTEFCRHFPACHQTLPKLSTSWEGDYCKGFIDISLFGVPHTFAGSPCTNEQKARADVARRVLWYLQCPGFSTKYEVDIEGLAKGLREIALPPSHWKVGAEV